MATNKKPLSPAAAKILEQYRNAGKSGPAASDSATPSDAPANAPRTAAPPPPGATMRRSGTRGK